MKQSVFRLLIILGIVFVGVGVDQVTKQAARQHLEGRGIVNVVGSTLVLMYTENEGAFLGVGGSLPPRIRFVLITFLPTLVIAFLGFWLFLRPGLSTMQVVAFSLIAAGGASNLFDRLFHNGRVVDFINLGIGRFRTGVFNVADLLIMVGAVLLLVAVRQPLKEESTEE